MQSTESKKEFLADLLKERIYSTFALVAVLVSIDSDHTSDLHAMFLVAGTIISLWAASIVASQISQRVVFQTDKDHAAGLELSLKRHSAMLFALIVPIAAITLASINLISLKDALDFSIVASFGLLITWLVQSAKTLHTSKLVIAIMILLQAVFIAAIIGLKVIVSH